MNRATRDASQSSGICQTDYRTAKPWQHLAFFVGICWFSNALSPIIAAPQELQNGLTFLASFDQAADANWGAGDRRIYHAKSLKLEQPVAGLPESIVQHIPQGKFGGCLKFGARSEVFTFFKGQKNIAINNPQLSGTVSLWMKLDPQKDLEPGFVDPLQITDKTWNDSCLFLDFTKDDIPRQFRLGVFSDYKFWNPSDINWDNIAVADRPMIVVEKPTFAADRWTHVVFTWHDFNGQSSKARLFIDGKPQGELNRPQKITWDVNKLAIILGIYYTGSMDELAIWNRALTDQEVMELHQRSESLSRLLPAQ